MGQEAATQTQDKPKDGIETGAKWVDFHVGDNTYRIPFATKEELAQDYRDLEAYLQANRKGPIESILPEVERLKAFPHLQKELLDRAYADLRKGNEERTVSNEDIRSFTNTMPGLLRTLGSTFRRHYPDLTDNDLLEIITRVGGAEAMKARDKVIRQALVQVMGEAKVRQMEKDAGNS